MLHERGEDEMKSKMKLLNTVIASAVSKWNYHERKSKNVGVITEWIKSSHLTVKAKARFDRALDQLRQLPRTSWHKPNPASVIGDHTYVIRFTEVTGAQIRVYGHFFDPHTSFVMTFDGGEKDNEYYPTDYQNVAQRHRTECDKDLQGKTLPFRQYCSICPEQKPARADEHSHKH